MRFKIILLVFSLFFASACTRESSSLESFDRAAMLQNLADHVIIPAYRNFATQASALHRASQQFATSPNLQSLTALQAAWQSAGNAWKQCELYNFGAVKELEISSAVYFSPARPGNIEKAIGTSQPINNAYIESNGATVKGFAALEYLLFDAAGNEQAIVQAFTDSPQRRSYLLALAENIHNKANAALQAWNAGYRDTFVKATEISVYGSVNILVNNMIALIENIKNVKVGEPSGLKNNGEPRPQLVEALLSKGELQHIYHEVKSLENTFFGINPGTQKNEPGLDDYLDHVNAQYQKQPLSVKTGKQFQATYRAIEAIKMPLQDAVMQQKTEVENLHKQLAYLQVLLQVDVASQLGVIITFGDNDGD